MIKKIIMVGLSFSLLLSCEKQEQEYEKLLSGIWNYGVINNDNNTYTLPFDGKLYKSSDGYISIFKKSNNDGSISDIAENIDIINIKGEYPLLKLNVKLTDVGFKNNKKVEKSYYGIIKIHFINKNQIWFENELSEELDQILKIRYFSMKYGANNIYYKAEQVDKPIHRDSDQLE